MTRAEAAAVLGSGWLRLPLLHPELTPALALPASPRLALHAPPPAVPPTFTRTASRSRVAAAAGLLLLSAIQAGH